MELPVGQPDGLNLRRGEPEDGGVPRAANADLGERGDDLKGEPSEVDVSLPPVFVKAETIGMIYIEEEGLWFFLNLEFIEAIFANFALAADRRHRQAVLE